MARKLIAKDDRKEFYAAIETGELDLIQTIKWMRKIVGKSQIEFAKMIGIAPRIIMDIERGVGNPTLETLNKIGKPFGLTLSFVKTRT
jgi:DNA-binding XRE family transcriptional regulator